METLSPAATQRVEAAIVEVEKQSSGEVVVLSVGASDRYHDVRGLYAAAFASCAAAIAHLLQPGLAVALLLWLQLGVGIATWLLLGRAPPLLRLLLPYARVERSVQLRARVAFLEHELFATRERSGVLIMISELERHVVILGDRGIHERLPEGAWQAHVARMLQGFRAGDPASALCDVVAELGVVLAQSFPRREDDRNELPNHVRREA